MYSYKNIIFFLSVFFLNCKSDSSPWTKKCQQALFGLKKCYRKAFTDIALEERREIIKSNLDILKSQQPNFIDVAKKAI